jgi:hypothetical protein
MTKISIPEADTISFKDFSEGNSIQVRAVISKAEEHSFDKGQTVTVTHQGNEANAIQKARRHYPLSWRRYSVFFSFIYHFLQIVFSCFPQV